MSIAVLEKETIRSAAYPLSLEAFHALAAAGKIPENLELIEGLLVEKMTVSPLHTFISSLLYDLVSATLPQGMHCRKAEPLTLSRSEPEPDIAVVPGSRSDYLREHPKNALFIVEVAVTSLELYREKAGIYAQGLIPEYWIVDCNSMQLEVYRKPGDGGYTEHVIYTAEDTLPFPVGSGQFRLADAGRR